MSPVDPTDNPLGSPLKAPSFVSYVVVLVGCLFAIFYTYKASRENAPAPMQQGQLTSRSADQAASATTAKPEAAAPATPQAPQGPAPASPTATSQPIAAPAPNAPAPSQGAQPGTAPQSAPGNEDLELAFNGHCRECHSLVKDDNRLGPTLYGVVGRKAGTVPDFAYSDSVKGSDITWDEPTLDKWITDQNALIPGNNMGAKFGGVADPDEQKKDHLFFEARHAGCRVSVNAEQDRDTLSAYAAKYPLTPFEKIR